MCIVIRIILASILVVFCFAYIRHSVRNNIKDMDEFRRLSLLKKIDMVFTDENDLLNANKIRDILGMILCLLLMIYLVMSCFKL